MEQIIKVIISANGTTAREINPYEKPSPPDPETRRAYDGQMEAYDWFYKEWKDAEKNLRNFEIDFSHFIGFMILYLPGQEREGKIMEDGKIRII